MGLDALLALLEAGQLQTLLKAAGTLSALAPLLADKETVEAAQKALQLLREAEEKGVLDRAAEALDKAQPLIEALGEVDYGALAAAVRALADPEPGEAGVRELLAALRDERFRRGLARLIAFVEALGGAGGEDS